MDEKQHPLANLSDLLVQYGMAEKGPFPRSKERGLIEAAVRVRGSDVNAAWLKRKWFMLPTFGRRVGAFA